MTYIFCNIGWMENYRGTKNDKIASGKIAGDKPHWEVCNFASQKNKIYGYVPLQKRNINIDKLGANSSDPCIKKCECDMDRHEARGRNIYDWLVHKCDCL